MPEKSEQTPTARSEESICFVIMPISDPDGYVKSHFNYVYRDIIQPACGQAGFSSIRGDEVKQSNLIHLDILQKLIESPMAICDLSSRNPNVLFELALRQAFDKPVALIQEVGTQQIFDISPFRYTEYRKERIYHEVLEDQKAISTAIRETFESHGEGRGINSIVKLLALSRPAALPEIGQPEAKADFQRLVLAEVSQLRDEIREVRRNTRIDKQRVTQPEVAPELARMRDLLMHLEMLLLSTDDVELNRIESGLAECRRRLTRFMHTEAEESIAMRNKDIMGEIEYRLNMLEDDFAERRSSAALKKK